MPTVSMKTTCDITFSTIDDMQFLRSLLQAYWDRLKADGAVDKEEEMPDSMACLYDRAQTAIEAMRMECLEESTASIGDVAYPDFMFPPIKTGEAP